MNQQAFINERHAALANVVGIVKKSVAKRKETSLTFRWKHNKTSSMENTFLEAMVMRDLAMEEDNIQNKKKTQSNKGVYYTAESE